MILGEIFRSDKHLNFPVVREVLLNLIWSVKKISPKLFYELWVFFVVIIQTTVIIIEQIHISYVTTTLQCVMSKVFLSRFIWTDLIIGVKKNEKNIKLQIFF